MERTLHVNEDFMPPLTPIIVTDRPRIEGIFNQYATMIGKDLP